MKRMILALSLSVAFAAPVLAQKAESRASVEAQSQTSAAITQGAKSINLESGTRLAGDLQSAIDVRKAKVGDQVVLKTTQAIKSGGQTVVSKGSRLVGRITEVSKQTGSNGESRVGILFDRLEQGSLAMPIAATITSVTSAAANASLNNDGFGSNAGASGSASSSTSTRSSNNNGGLLGGAGSIVSSTTSTVGSVVGGTTSAVGSTVDSATGTLGSAGKSLGGIQISQSSNASVEGSSVLSLQSGNLRLEKGTHFNLVLTQSASAGARKDQ